MKNKPFCTLQLCMLEIELSDSRPIIRCGTIALSLI